MGRLRTAGHGAKNVHMNLNLTRNIRSSDMNRTPKFQAFPLTRKPRRIDIIKDAALLVFLVAAMGFIFYLGYIVGF